MRGSRRPDGDGALSKDLLDIVASEINVKEVEPISDGSDLVDRRVKVLLPKVGKRLGAAIPAVMAAAREGSAAFHDDGSVTLAGETLTADEVEIQATPRPGTAVAEDDGLVMVLDTALTDELRAEGDARELARAVQDLRREAGLELDDVIELWVEGLPDAVATHLAGDRHRHACRAARWRATARHAEGHRRARRRFRDDRVAEARLTTTTASATRPAARDRARWPIFLGLAALVFVADQISKAWLVSFLAPGQRIDVLGDYVRLVHSQNNGALFGLFRDQAIVFAIVSVGVVGAIIWFHRSSGRNTLLSVALGLLLGGALGNMADRFRIGYVVDFVDLGIGTCAGTRSMSPTRRSVARSCCSC